MFYLYSQSKYDIHSGISSSYNYDIHNDTGPIINIDQL